MSNILMNYFQQPIEQLHEKKLDHYGPVVAISRECGCSANRIAIKLSKILTGYSYQSENKKELEWKWINKEVIEKAAQELEMNPEKIRGVFLGEAKMSLHEVTTAFSTSKCYDADDQKVIDTVTNVIKQLAQEGHILLVGRAGNVLSQHIPIDRRLSVKLIAPLEWRIRRIMNISNMNRSDAQEYVLAVDNERDLFVEHVAGRKLSNTDFDVVFNYATLSDDYIVDAIVNILKSKRIIVAS
jgi:cytidylate kinase